MSATGRGSARSPGDYYRTPRWAIDAMIKREAPWGIICDPGCGDGAISEALAELKGVSRVIGHEKNPVLAAKAREKGIEVIEGYFLDYSSSRTIKTRPPYDFVIGNPPYKLASEFVRGALDVVRPGGKVAFLLRLGYLGSSRKRLDLVGESSSLSRVWVLARRPSFTSDNRTDASDYAWFVWTRDAPLSRRTYFSVLDEGIER